jgi:hypothetical protein
VALFTTKQGTMIPAGAHFIGAVSIAAFQSGFALRSPTGRVDLGSIGLRPPS